MIIEFSRDETRPDLATNFYVFTDADNSVYTSIPYFLEKTETLSADGLVLSKKFRYQIDTHTERFQEIYDNQSLKDLNQKIYEYCVANNITRTVLKASVILENTDPVEINTFPERP